MKNVYTSWDLTLLADKLIEKINESWKNPFCSPAVVFTDPKTEQWFKLIWLKNKASGNSILMNLKTLRIQQFLFDLVALTDSEKLSVELLRDVIISKLTEKNSDGKYYFETLGAPEVEVYLTSQASDSKINANHLYDFSETIASLFMDYEDTRPDSLNELLEKSLWQKKLYNDVIGKDGTQKNGTKYLTLFQLAELNKKENSGSLVFNWSSDRPVFIFGFSGLGQIYRNILNEFSKEHNLEVFIQALDNEEKAENQLLEKWSKFGNEHLSLWIKDTPSHNLSSPVSYSKTDTLLHRIQKTIAENSHIEKESFSEKDNSLSLTAAPTRLREIEALHSKICSLLAKDKMAQLGDILVVAPQIQDYKTAIEQVFDQTDQFAADSAFPYLPYTIADFSGERSLTAEALNILFGIIKKGYLSRSDFFALLHNYLVQTVRNISDEEISNWADWASNLNIYRDRKNHEDWQKAKARLLLARLTSDLTETNERQLLPYESMSTTDSDSLYKFIQVIDELEEWASYSVKEKLCINDINRLEELLKNWLLLNDNIPEGLYNESLVFQNVVEEIERQRLTAAPDIFTDCFANGLFDRSAAVTLHSANILTRGITFANFESNRILSAKYIFFIGLDSKNFPGLDSDNELDLRKKTDRQTGDESIPLKNKNAFLCQFMAAREGIFFSYVNKNLQKDEDFFMSSVLKDLFETIYSFNKKLKKQPYEKQINIDEDRLWSELYTQKEFRNKKNFIKLQESDNESENTESSRQSQSTELSQDSTSTTQKVSALPDRITIGQMKSYLQEPFIYMVNQTLNSNYDDEEKEQFEFEPLSLNARLSSLIRKAYIQSSLNNENTVTKESISFDLDIQNVLPDDFFGEKSTEKVLEDSKIILKKIKEKCIFINNLVFNENKMLLIKQEAGITPKDWFVSGELAWYNKDFSELKILNTLELSNSENVLTGYISSLILLASQPESDTSLYSIILNAVVLQDGLANIKSQHYMTTPALARTNLNKIYRAMFISKFEKSAPAKLVMDDFKNNLEDQLSFQDFKKKLLNAYGKGEWQYFSKRKFFDLDKDIGYTYEGFPQEWLASKAHQAELIQYIAQSVKKSENKGE